MYQNVCDVIFGRPFVNDFFQNGESRFEEIQKFAKETCLQVFYYLAELILCRKKRNKNVLGFSKDIS